MCLCRSERTSFTNGNLKGSINAGRYTADYLQCGNLPYLAWKNAHNCAGLSYRRIRRYLVWRLKRLEARDFSRVRIKFLIHNDACSILCNVTGIAILHNDFINFDIIISSYFLFVLNQPVTRFLSYILLHRALPPDIQLPLSPLSLLPDESLWGKDYFPCLPCYHQNR